MHTTVALCTRNRRESLLATLEALARQTADSAPEHGALSAPVPPASSAAESWELLVVDNGSSDGSAAALRARVETARDGWAALRIVSEGQEGLARARNRALREARADWVLFADDDVTPVAGWLAAHRRSRSVAPADTVAIGGPIGVALPRGAPEGFADILEDELGGPSARLELGSLPFTYTADDPRPLPFGGNLALDRRAALAAGGFREDLGRGSGPVAVQGEETELLERLQRAGGRVLYAPDARVEHRVTADRLQPAAYLAWHRGHGRALVRAAPPLTSVARTRALGEETWRVTRYWLRARVPGPLTVERARLWRKLGRAQGRWLELSGR